jgi:hypothetical protein
MPKMPKKTAAEVMRMKTVKGTLMTKTLRKRTETATAMSLTARRTERVSNKFNFYEQYR